MRIKPKSVCYKLTMQRGDLMDARENASRFSARLQLRRRLIFTTHLSLTSIRPPSHKLTLILILTKSCIITQPIYMYCYHPTQSNTFLENLALQLKPFSDHECLIVLLCILSLLMCFTLNFLCFMLYRSGWSLLQTCVSFSLFFAF